MSPQPHKVVWYDPTVTASQMYMPADLAHQLNSKIIAVRLMQPEQRVGALIVLASLCEAWGLHYNFATLVSADEAETLAEFLS